MEEEFNSLTHNDTFKLILLPAGCKPIQTCWLYKIKHKADGSINHFKACWVAKGYLQCYGIDYDETFTPVMRMENLHLLLAIATALDSKIHQMDMDTTFLQAQLEEEVYTTQPEGFMSTKHP